MTKKEMFAKLRDDYGYASNLEMLEAAATDSVCPCICTDCGYTCELEPDQDRGYCENCGGQHVKSVLILAGVI